MSKGYSSFSISINKCSNTTNPSPSVPCAPEKEMDDVINTMVVFMYGIFDTVEFTKDVGFRAERHAKPVFK